MLRALRQPLCVRRCALFFLLAGCTDPATQLVVEVDTDYRWPEELRFVDVFALDPDGIASMDQLHYELGVAPAVAVPFSFGIAPREGEEDRELTLVVEGRLDRDSASPLVIARAKTGFVREKALYLGIFLGKSCGGIPCEFEETCFGGSCISNAQPPEQLDPYRPDLDPPRPPVKDGGGVDDAGQDAGADAAVDAGVDAGVEDVGVDGGVLPDGCGISIGAPGSIGSASIAFEPNLDVLAANLDGDNVIELAVGRAEVSSSPIAIIDFDDCDGPVVTATAAYGELRQGLLYANGLFAVERRKISRWSYLGPNMISEAESAVATGANIERLVFGASDGTGMSVVDLGSGWSYARMDRAGGFAGALSAPQRPRGFSAFFRGDIYLHGDDAGLRTVDPGFAVSDVVLTLEVSDPVVVDLDDGDALIASRAEDELLVVSWKNGGVMNSAMTDFNWAIIAGPIAARSNDEVRFFVLLENGLLASCVPNEDTGACAISSGMKQFPLAEIDDGRSLLAAFVDQDSWPDIVFVSLTGKVFFQRGDALDADAAPMLDLGDGVRAAPAIALDFFAAYNREGSLLVVPHDGSVSLIPFLGRPAEPDDLWPQHRRDARRSARLP